MEYVTLANGLKMPILGYGVYQVTKDECGRCVLDAISVPFDICTNRASAGINGIKNEKNHNKM